MVALHGYLEGYHPPGITNPSLWKRVGRVLLDAHQAAVRAAPRRARGAAGRDWPCSCPLLHPPATTTACRAFCRRCAARSSTCYLDGLTGPDRGDWLGVQYYRKQWVDPASPGPVRRPAAGRRR